MNLSVQQRTRPTVTLRRNESVVVRCRDNQRNRRGRRLVVTLRPGDRVLVRCRDNNRPS